MFTSDKVGAEGENLFKWEAVSGKFDPSKAYPTITPEDLPKEGWQLRVPSDSSIKYAAEIADTVREVGPIFAMDFVNKKEKAGKGDAEEQYITKQFRAFMFANLGYAPPAQGSEI